MFADFVIGVGMLKYSGISAGSGWGIIDSDSGWLSLAMTPADFDLDRVPIEADQMRFTLPRPDRRRSHRM